MTQLVIIPYLVGRNIIHKNKVIIHTIYITKYTIIMSDLIYLAPSIPNMISGVNRMYNNSRSVVINKTKAITCVMSVMCV